MTKGNYYILTDLSKYTELQIVNGDMGCCHALVYRQIIGL